MITQEEIDVLLSSDSSKSDKQKVLYQMTEADLKMFEKASSLPGLIADRKIQNDIDKGLKTLHGYSDIEEKCNISVTSLKKTINGTQKPTRTFLYKFAVGLKMTRQEADQYFILCGGILRDDCLEDKICINALRDGDDVYQFEEELEKYTRFIPKRK